MNYIRDRSSVISIDVLSVTADYAKKETRSHIARMTHLEEYGDDKFYAEKVNNKASTYCLLICLVNTYLL